MDFRFSNTLGWNTFPVPTLTEKNKADLTRCAENILLAREAHFPATIADLYDPEHMPPDLREAHERNDEVLERILYRSPLQERHRAAGKAVRALYENDGRHRSRRQAAGEEGQRAEGGGMT